MHGRRVHARAWSGSSDTRRTPVVMVHGFGISSSYFVPLGKLLASEFAPYAPDLPGHGKSETPPRPLDVPALADALVAWMDALEIDRAALVGNSMGCQIVAEAAVRFPQRVERLVLIGPTVDPAARAGWRQIGRLLRGGYFERISLVGILLRDFARMGPRLLPEFRFMLEDRIEQKLLRVAAPVMLVRGERDYVAPPRWLEEAARLVSAEATAVIPRWGHGAHYSAADVTKEKIAPFLRGEA
jgi:2-hydroxy-6-oxonona-2,4-dienedioate hydrolase